MSRDEKHTRATALAPQRQISHGVALLRPTDVEGGGSWISVNLSGHSLALLNRYEDGVGDPAPEGTWISRGGIVVELGHLRGADEVGSTLAGMPLASYKPFTLASVRATEAWLFEWDGKSLETLPARPTGLLRSSSSVAQAEAEAARTLVFRQAAERAGGLTSEALEELFRSHLPEQGACSICMHREDAETVSLSLITVFKSDVWFRYVAGNPCQSTTEVIRRLTATAGM